MKSAYNKQSKLAAAGLHQKIAAAQKRGDAAAVASLTKQRSALRSFDDLDSREQSILFSTYYHQGNISNQAIRPFVDSVMSGNDVGAQTALAEKAASAQSLIASRGKAELAYWTSHTPVRP